MIGIRNYAIVTAAYWAFTLTDGALRLLMLLHFHELGYTPAASHPPIKWAVPSGVVIGFLAGLTGSILSG